MTAADCSCAPPRTVAVRPLTVMLAPMRLSSCTCMKRFSKMFSVTVVVPSHCVARAMYCACMSVGKAGVLLGGDVGTLERAAFGADADVVGGDVRV